MATKPPVSSSNSDDSESSSNEVNNSIPRASDRIIPRETLLVGYMHLPAEIVVRMAPPSGSSLAGLSLNMSVQEVKFIGPELDISPLYQEMEELKILLKEILDSKQLSQEIGNELVGESYLRWDT